MTFKPVDQQECQDLDPAGQRSCMVCVLQPSPPLFSYLCNSKHGWAGAVTGQVSCGSCLINTLLRDFFGGAGERPVLRQGSQGGLKLEGSEPVFSQPSTPPMRQTDRRRQIGQPLDLFFSPLRTHKNEL